MALKITRSTKDKNHFIILDEGAGTGGKDLAIAVAYTGREFVRLKKLFSGADLIRLKKTVKSFANVMVFEYVGMVSENLDYPNLISDVTDLLLERCAEANRKHMLVLSSEDTFDLFEDKGFQDIEGYKSNGFTLYAKAINKPA